MQGVVEFWGWARRGLVVALVCGAALGLSACHLDMYDQPKYEPYEPSSLFSDGTSARPIEQHTVRRDGARFPLEVQTGRIDGEGAFLTTIPLSITAEMSTTGARKFGVYCATCHGANGEKNALIEGYFKAYKAQYPPPALTDEKARALSDGQIFDIITNGVIRDDLTTDAVPGNKNSMFPYGTRLSIEERWAIVAHVRQLQQQNAAPPK